MFFRRRDSVESTADYYAQQHFSDQHTLKGITDALTRIHLIHSEGIDNICTEYAVHDRDALKILDWLYLQHMIDKRADDPIVALRKQAFKQGRMIEQSAHYDPKDVALTALVLNESYARRMYKVLTENVLPKLRM